MQTTQAKEKNWNFLNLRFAFVCINDHTIIRYVRIASTFSLSLIITRKNWRLKIFYGKLWYVRLWGFRCSWSFSIKNSKSRNNVRILVEKINLNGWILDSQVIWIDNILEIAWRNRKTLFQLVFNSQRT